jgi:hypothetical protein
MVQQLQNIFPGSQLIGSAKSGYLLIHEPCIFVMQTLLAQGYETGIFIPFNNPIQHAGGMEFRTRGLGPGFHFRVVYPAEVTYPMETIPLQQQCPQKDCTLDEFHIDPHNPLGGGFGNFLKHAVDLVKSWF